MNAAEIRTWRKRHGVSQAQLADLLGVTTRMVQYWEAPNSIHYPPNMLYLALQGLGHVIAEKGGSIDAVTREQLAREALGYV